jgi:hypothetical protein
MAVDISKDIDNEMPVGLNLGPIVVQARKQIKLEQKIANLEAELKVAKAELRKLSEETIPDLAESMGITHDISLGNGYTLQISPVLRASLPANSTIEKADRDEQPLLLKRLKDGLTWLRKNKGGDLIKDTIKLDLGKGHMPVVKEFMALAKQHRVRFERAETIHPGSLSKFIRECLQVGKDVPMETFGVFRGREAIINAPKKSKTKETK